MLSTLVANTVETKAISYFNSLPRSQKGTVLIITGAIVGAALIGIGIYLKTNS